MTQALHRFVETKQMTSVNCDHGPLHGSAFVPSLVLDLFASRMLLLLPCNNFSVAFSQGRTHFRARLSSTCDYCRVLFPTRHLRCAVHFDTACSLPFPSRRATHPLHSIHRLSVKPRGLAKWMQRVDVTWRTRGTSSPTSTTTMRTSEARLRRVGGCRETRCRARREEEGRGTQGAPKRLETKVLGRWSEKGYFAMEDPNAPLQSLEKRKKPIPDVLDSKEPIWNTNWQEKLDAVARDEARKKREAELKSRPASGFLSFSRLNTLADTHLDLSEQLSGTRKSCADDQPNGPEGSQLDEPLETTSSETDRTYNDVYEEETNNLIVWTLVSTVVCSNLVLLFYSESKAASYAIGAMFGLTYFAMLSTSVAAVGSNDLFKRARGLIGQPRILVPMLMVFSWKKWGLVVEEQVGIHLELTFMIAGFFTYQIGTFAQVLQSQRR